MIVITAALGLVAISHFHAHIAFLRGMNTLDAFRATPAPVPQLDTPVARRVWVLLVDGLGFDAGIDLPAVQHLASVGVSRLLVADFPSFTYPGITTLATGVPPRHSGIRLHGPGPYPQWDSVARRAEAADVPVSYVHDRLDALPLLLQLPTSAKRTELNDLLARESDGEPARELAWIYFGEVDVADHVYGGASAEYAAAARRADDLIDRLRSALDLQRDALVVLSDHGHLDRGGHGGLEPASVYALFVAAGPMFSRGTDLTPAPMRAVAPTLAAALGVDPPRNAMGNVMADALGMASPAAMDRVRTTERQWQLAFKQLAKRRAVRAAWLWLVACVLVLAALRRWRPSLPARDALPAVAYVAAFLVAYRALGYGLSWSIPRGEAGFNLETAIIGFPRQALRPPSAVGTEHSKKPSG